MSKISEEAQQLLALEREVEMYDEVDITSIPLKAASFFIGDHCARQGDAYMYCRSVIRHPEKCFHKSVEYTECVKDVLNKIKMSCSVPFNKYWRCLESNYNEFIMCRDEEEGINSCMKEKFGIRKRLFKKQTPEEGFHPEGYTPEGHAKAAFNKFVKENKHDYQEITPY